MIAIRHAQATLLDQLVKSRFIELFGAITETVPLSYYIEALNAGKSLAGEEECPNKVLKTGAITYDYFDATQVKKTCQAITNLWKIIVSKLGMDY